MFYGGISDTSKPPENIYFQVWKKEEGAMDLASCGSFEGGINKAFTMN